MYDYSEKELKLFEFFGVSHLLKSSVSLAPVVYRAMVEKAFMDDIKGPEVESLRRCYNALMKCTVYRMTKDWDALIEFSNE